MSFLSKLSPRERNIIYIGVIAACLFLIDQVVFPSLMTGLNSLNDKIASVKETIQTDRFFLQNEKGIREEHNKYQNYIKPNPSGDPATELAKIIQKIAVQTGVKIEKGPNPFTTIGEQSKIGVSLECLGETKNVMQFIYQITHSETHILKVERMIITSKANLLFCNDMIITEIETP